MKFLLKIKLVILLSVVLLNGCTTTLWSNQYKHFSIEGFYINTENNDLLVSDGEKAFIFPVSESFAKALLISREIEFTPKFNNFYLDKENIKGEVELTVKSESLSDEEKQYLSEIGFNEKGLLVTPIKGKVYKIEGELPLQKLENTYTVSVELSPSFVDTAGKIVATPATIAYDAMVVVPSVFIIATLMLVGSN